MTYWALAAVVLLPALLARPARAQQSPAPPAPRTTPVPQGPLDLGLNDSTSRRIADGMARDLVKLRDAERTYYGAHHGYAFTVAALAPFTPTAGTVMTITPTDGGGYRAVATNPALPGAEFEAVVPRP